MRFRLARLCWENLQNLDLNSTYGFEWTSDCKQCFNWTDVLDVNRVNNADPFDPPSWEDKVKLSLLIISNFFLLLAIYVAIKAELYQETVLYIFTMFVSSVSQMAKAQSLHHHDGITSHFILMSLFELCVNPRPTSS